MLDRSRCQVGGEDRRIDPFVEGLQHRVEGGICPSDLMELLDARDARDVHIADDLHRIGAPRGDELTARTDEEALEGRAIKRRSPTEEPGEAIQSGGIQRSRALYDIEYRGALFPKESDHSETIYIV